MVVAILHMLCIPVMKIPGYFLPEKNYHEEVSE